MRHDANHSPHLGAVLADRAVVDPPQAERAQCRPLVVGAADRRPDLGHLEPGHQEAPAPAARARSIAGGATSSSGSPRRAAISSGRIRPRRAATVACTMLIGLAEPSDFDSTSATPAHYSTARTGPPALSPVPGEAGLGGTAPAAASP